MHDQDFDHGRAAAFEQRLTGVLNGAALALMASIGHRTGLFDAMRRLGATSGEALAHYAGLDERHVRGWLGAMAAGGITEYDPTTRAHRLPQEHAAFLTRHARPSNVAASCQCIAALGAVEDRIIECFERGGGVPGTAFEHFHAVMAEESDQNLVAGLCQHIVPLVSGLPDALARGIPVLEVACGSGRVLHRMARAWPKSLFTGYDLSPEAIAAASVGARELGLPNVRFEVHDAAELRHQRDFDLVTAFVAMRDQARPDAVLRCIARALRPGGTFLMQDVAGTSVLLEGAQQPLAPFLYTLSCLHGMTVSPAGGGAWGEETARRMLAEAGFARLEVRRLPHDAVNQYYLARTS